MLQALFTDSCCYSIIGKCVSKICFLPVSNFKRLANRIPHGVPKEKIYSTDMPFLKCAIRNLVGNPYTIREKWCALLSIEMKKWFDEIKHVDIIYNMFCENIEFLRYVKSRKQDVKILSDIYVHPYAETMVDDERKRLLVADNDKIGIQKIGINEIEEVCKLSDVLLCPSEFVANGILNISKSFEGKIKISPYGSSISSFGRSKDIKLSKRVLWAGNDWVRKGLLCFSAVATKVKELNPDIDFRVAGLLKNDSKHFQEMNHITFLGKLDKGQMRDEYINANCFLLPTLAEGMAAVVIEALSSGCPVVTTRAAGVDNLVNEVGGYIVENGEIDKIAKCVVDICTDEKLYAKLSENAKNIAEYYSMDSWSKRLVMVVNSVWSSG